MSHLNINGVDKPLDHIRLNNVRSENLLNKAWLNNDRQLSPTSGMPNVYAGRIATINPIDVSNIDTVTLTYYLGTTATEYFMYSIFSGGTLIERVAGKTSGDIIDVTNADALYICLYVGGENITVDDVQWVMLNLGSTALPYQPYLITKEAWEAKSRVILHGLTNPLCGIGTYKDTLDLSTGVLTRYVKKLVLTGNETWIVWNNNYYSNALDSLAINASPCFCTHFINSSSSGINIGANASKLKIASAAVSDFVQDVEGLKQWLADEYSAGHPVTVWYVLATPETEQITLPSNLTGIVEGYLTQSSTPSPTSPVYPTANGTLEQGGTYSLDTGAYAIAWGRADTFTGTNSISARCYGLPVKSWEIDGNSQQLGVPDPVNPIMPEFVGERTGNLFDTSTVTLGKYINAQGVETDSTAPEDYDKLNHTDYISVQPNTDYTYHFKGYRGVTNTIALNWFDSSKNLVARNIKTLHQTDYNYTLTAISPSTAVYCIVNFCGYTPGGTSEFSFNTGTTALPYEPFGYKLPITSAGHTQAVYLGQVQTTRKIIKYEFDGSETWTKNSASATDYIYFLRAVKEGLTRYDMLCSHLPIARSGMSPTNVGVQLYSSRTTLLINVGADAMDAQPSGNTVAGLKEYLAQQYANGTPVTVWYVLATSETAIVNEPLAKIGDYADELHSADTSTTIPTTDGNNTISVDTALALSKFEVKVHAKPI